MCRNPEVTLAYSQCFWCSRLSLWQTYFGLWRLISATPNALGPLHSKSTRSYTRARPYCTTQSHTFSPTYPPASSAGDALIYIRDTCSWDRLVRIYARTWRLTERILRLAALCIPAKRTINIPAAILAVMHDFASPAHD